LLRPAGWPDANRFRDPVFIAAVTGRRRRAFGIPPILTTLHRDAGGHKISVGLVQTGHEQISELASPPCVPLRNGFFISLTVRRKHG